MTQPDRRKEREANGEMHQSCPPCSLRCDQGRLCPNRIPDRADVVMILVMLLWPVGLVALAALVGLAWRAWA